MRATVENWESTLFYQAPDCNDQCKLDMFCGCCPKIRFTGVNDQQLVFYKEFEPLGCIKDWKATRYTGKNLDDDDKQRVGRLHQVRTTENGPKFACCPSLVCNGQYMLPFKARLILLHHTELCKLRKSTISGCKNLNLRLC